MFEWLFKYPYDLFREGELRLAHAPRIEIVVLILAAFAAAAWWLYRREQRIAGSRRMLLWILRAAGFAAVLLALFSPVLKTRKRDSSAGAICIGIDVSKSMALSYAAGQSRFERAKQLLEGKNSLSERLAAAGNVRLFAFGNTTRPLQPHALAALTPADDNTLLAGAIKEMVQAERGGPVEALVLLTDGVDTTSADPGALAAFAASRGASVHAIGLGERSGAPDIDILAVNAPLRVQPGARVTASVIVRRGSYDGPLELRLFNDLVLLKSETIPASQNPGAPVTVDLNFILEKKGPAHLSVEIPPVSGEVSIQNNTRSFQVDVQDSRVEVLMVEGSPRHEYAFLRRAMWNDPNFRLVSLLRLGKGRAYQSQNDDTLMSGEFPQTAEELGRFKAIILSDIEASYFNAKQLAAITDFVRVRGGGLLMLGGVNAFNLGGYDATPLAQMLPVSLARDAAGAEFDDSEFTLELTADGVEHEILRLTPDPAENRSQWALMPALRGHNPLYSAKPGARVLAVKSGSAPDGRRAVLLAVQDVGAGRCGVFTPANSWRWRMGRKHDDPSYLRFWTQMLRWVAVGSREMLSVSTGAPIASLRQPVTVSASVLDKTHRPFNDAQVVAQIKDPFGNVEDLPLPWVLNEDGVYQAVVRPTEIGEYTINVVASAGDTKLERGVSLAVIESSAEFAHPSLDADTLTRIAKSGNGTVDLDGNADKAIESILSAASRKQKLTELVEERDLRDVPALLLLIAGLWIAEWITRKRGGLV